MSTIGTQLCLDLLDVVIPDVSEACVAPRALVAANPASLAIGEPVLCNNRELAILGSDRCNRLRVCVHTPDSLINELPRTFVAECHQVGPCR